MIGCILSCRSQEPLSLELKDKLMDVSSIDYSKCSIVFEDENYNIIFQCKQPGDEDIRSEDIQSIGMYVNGRKLEYKPKDIDRAENRNDEIKYEKAFEGQLFLSYYDFVVVSFVLTFKDNSSKEYFTDFLLCVSKEKEERENIQQMIEYLRQCQIGEWIFTQKERPEANSFYKGGWNRYTYKSLNAYVQLVSDVVKCYERNYTYFKVQGKHTIKQETEMVSYEKVKRISRESFEWLMQNTDQLTRIPFGNGISYKGKKYLPYRIKTNLNKKSWDVYENQVLVDFLYTVLTEAKQIYAEFDGDVLNEERVLSMLQGRVSKEYQAPIITIKSLQTYFGRILLKSLKFSVQELQSLYGRYKALLDIQGSRLTAFPRKTKTFIEVQPYSQVFEMIDHWQKYGEYSLKEEELLLQVKTLDRLFEYYCLLRLLKLFESHGYQKAKLGSPGFNYSYKSAGKTNEADIANTYILQKDNIKITVYYQPIISSVRFENDLSLYRTTKGTTSDNYYTPDFVLKFSLVKDQENHKEEYAIFDAKFSSRKTIKEYRLSEVICKYFCEIGVAAAFPAPKMVWVLQGRVNDEKEKAIWKYHNSQLAVQYRPVTSIGIVSFNTVEEVGPQLWNELENNIFLLQKEE